MTNLFAVINVGASAFRMLIGSTGTDGSFKELEYLIRPLRLGSDTYGGGYITLENVYRATEILTLFREKMDEYEIRGNYRALCTSGVREAANKHFLLDYVQRKTGIVLEILEPSEEIFIKYLGVRGSIPDFRRMEKEGLLFANIASGNIALSIMQNDCFLFSDAVPIGSLRLNQIFKDVPATRKYRMYESYIANYLHNLQPVLPERMQLKNLIGAGSSINLLISIFQPKENMLRKKQLEQFYTENRIRANADIQERYSLREDEVEVAVPTVATYLKLMEIIGATKILFSRRTFPETLYLYYTKNLPKRGMLSARRKTLYEVGRRYHFDEQHARKVAELSQIVFRSLKEIHALGKNESFMLEAAAILHDVGYFIDARKHHEHSYYIVRATTLPGISGQMMDVIAAICYLHRYRLADDSVIMESISPADRLLVNKLAAMLRIADALDTSHTQVMKTIQVTEEPGRILISAATNGDATMEKTAFRAKRDLFTETFGIAVELETRLDYE